MNARAYTSQCLETIGVSLCDDFVVPTGVPPIAIHYKRNVLGYRTRAEHRQ